MSDRHLVGVFETEAAILTAVRACRERGAIIDDVHTPYPVHGMDAAMGLKRSRLPYACFAFGLFGGGAMLYFQYWVSWFNWPINVGGRPWNSLPAFLPVTFESTVLFAGLGTAATFLLISRLLPGRRLQQPAARVTDDQFAVVLHTRGGEIDVHDLQILLRAHGAVAVTEQEADQPCATC